ncbi:MAG: 4'-phosphopantetheinyl transferase superfamily protein [Rhizobiaceae bacterium]|nr:4'-phosphopantetheinyl transferase superfamily protein [Rhizobiaceae bacterium]
MVNDWGKPRLSEGLYFNISHSDEWAVVAMESNHEVGVDIETGSLKLNLSEMEHVLSQAELKEIGEREHDPSALLRLWVRKEAVLKALGKGVSYDPRQITIGFPQPDSKQWRRVQIVDGEELTFQLIDIELEGDRCCAVALRCDNAPPYMPVVSRYSVKSNRSTSTMP